MLDDLERVLRRTVADEIGGYIAKAAADGRPTPDDLDQRQMAQAILRRELDNRSRAALRLGESPLAAEQEDILLERVLAEAFRLVSEGYVTPEDLDRTVADGLGLRWSFMGPFETIELNAPGGIPDYCARYTGFYKRLAAEPPPPAVYEPPATEAILRAWPAAADIPARTRRRDRRLGQARRANSPRRIRPP